MATPFRIAAALALLAAALQGSARGQAEAKQPARGRVLLLDTLRLMEGDVERQGEHYCVRRDGGEMCLPVARVLMLCDSREQAFAFLAGRTNLKDADERLRLANWCQVNGLREEAVRQLTAALEVRPRFPEAKQLLHLLQRTSAGTQDVPAAAAVQAPPPAVDVNLECLTTFVNKVQPILMNTCVRCHSGGKGGDFTLMRVHGSGALYQPATRFNLASVLRHVNAAQPEVSPLLVKAVSAHGSLKPPLAAIPFQTVQEWVHSTAAANPHLKLAAKPAAPPPAVQLTSATTPAPEKATPSGFAPERAATPPGELPPQVRTTPLPVPRTPQPKEKAAPGVRGGTVVGQTGAPPPAAPPQTPQARPQAEPAPAEPADEFDPAHFNKQGQPPR